jgi:hypothetical protein
VLNGTWKEAFTKASVAQLLVSMGRDKAARLHLNQMAEAAEAAILSTHWVSLDEGHQLCWLYSPAWYTAA